MHVNKKLKLDNEVVKHQTTSSSIKAVCLDGGNNSNNICSTTSPKRICGLTVISGKLLSEKKTTNKNEVKDNEQQMNSEELSFVKSRNMECNIEKMNVTPPSEEEVNKLDLKNVDKVDRKTTEEKEKTSRSCVRIKSSESVPKGSTAPANEDKHRIAAVTKNICSSEMTSLEDHDKVTLATSESSIIAELPLGQDDKALASSDDDIQISVKNINKKTDDCSSVEQEKHIKLLLTMETYVKNILNLMQKEEANAAALTSLTSAPSCSSLVNALIDLPQKQEVAAADENLSLIHI